MLSNIYVVDELMGAGKTSAMINMLRPGRRKRGQRYLYITPYLNEVKRIKQECGFYEPKYIGSKTRGIKELLKQRRCIVTTHSLFKLFDNETLALIEDGCYRLIIDEAIIPIEPSDITDDDIQMLKEAGSITNNSEGFLKWERAEYDGLHYRAKSLCERGALVARAVENFEDYKVMWQLPAEVFKAFYNVYILTYRFSGQLLKHYLETCGFMYTNKYVRETDGDYELSDIPVYRPRPKYGDLIKIVMDDDLNRVGESKHALSMNWYKNPGNIGRAKRGLKTWLDTCARGEPSRVMWTSFVSVKSKMWLYASKRGFLPCNAKATNEFAGRDILAYMVNRFPNLHVKLHLESRGVYIDDDEFALSEMLQWIFRSAVRNGKGILIYIPSKRMRDLLISWIAEMDANAETADVA